MTRLFTVQRHDFLPLPALRPGLSMPRRCPAALGVAAAVLTATLLDGSALAAEPAASGAAQPTATETSEVQGVEQPPIEPTPVAEAVAAPAAPPQTEHAAVKAEPVPKQAARASDQADGRDKHEDDEDEDDASNEDGAKKRRGPGALLGGDGDKIDFGGYGGVTAMGTWISQTPALLLGLEGGLLLDHRLAIGFAGYALSSRVKGPRFSNGNESLLGFGYGGLSLRYQFVCEGPIYASFGTLLGGGMIALLERSDDETLGFNENEQSANGFLVIEPSAQAHANLTHWMRLGLNGSFRIVHGVNSYGYEEKDFRGFSFGGHLQFGWF